MRLVRYRRGPVQSTGALLGERVIDLPRLCGSPADMLALLGDARELEKAQEALGRRSGTEGEYGLPLSEVQLLAPVPNPGKIVGVGFNYPSPGQEREAARPPYPVLFERNAGSLIGPGEAIRLPPETQQAAIECELVLVVGKGGKRIPESQALEALAGYSVANDVTARDLERRASQWTGGKLLDAFLPLGPGITTRDEIPDPAALRMRSWINETPVQDGFTGEMLYAPAELVAYISWLITLRPGDLILTGSPKRLGRLPAPEVFLQAGDRVRLEIEGLGGLENPVEAEKHG